MAKRNSENFDLFAPFEDEQPSTEGKKSPKRGKRASSPPPAKDLGLVDLLGTKSVEIEVPSVPDSTHVEVVPASVSREMEAQASPDDEVADIAPTEIAPAEIQERALGEPRSVVRVEVPGSGGRTVGIVLEADHGIWIERDGAWSGFNESPATRYSWEGGVPSPDAPSVPDDGRYTKARDLWRDPVGAVMLLDAPGKRLSREDRAEAKRLWEDLWRATAPSLDSRAASLAYQYGYTADLYQLLAVRPDLCDHLEVCPALGPFLTIERARQIPEIGWSLQRIAQHLLRGREDTLPDISPGFMAWAQRMEWGQDHLPLFPSKRIDRFPSMRGFVRNALNAGESIDPNGIHKVQSSDEWLLVNLALSSEGTARFIPAILKDPSAATNHVSKYFPPDLRSVYLPDGSELLLDRRSRISRVLEVIRDWAQSEPERAGQIEGFGRLVKEARKWDATMRRMETADADRQLFVEAELARRHQEAIAAMDEERAAAVAKTRDFQFTLDEEFPHLLPVEERVVENENLRLVMLATPEDLLLEGHLASHCVGGAGYIRNCLQGEIYIFSLRDKRAEEAYVHQYMKARREGRELPQSPRPIATIEATSSTLRIKQMHGYNNKSPIAIGRRKWAKLSLDEFGRRLGQHRSLSRGGAGRVQ